ncbi:hypothetical protein Tco_1516046 [Tanacetum coccineum]
MVTKARDTSKYCEFHQDYDNDINVCRELKNQIEEAIKFGKLVHLLRVIRKGKAKQNETQLREWQALPFKGELITEEKEEPVLMIGVVNKPLKRKEYPRITSVEEMIFPPIRNSLQMDEDVKITNLVDHHMYIALARDENWQDLMIALEVHRMLCLQQMIVRKHYVYENEGKHVTVHPDLEDPFKKGYGQCMERDSVNWILNPDFEKILS